MMAEFVQYLSLAGIFSGFALANYYEYKRASSELIPIVDDEHGRKHDIPYYFGIVGRKLGEHVYYTNKRRELKNLNCGCGNISD